MINHIHFLSLNVQGLRDRLKRSRLKEYIDTQNAHIVYLQETHFTNDITVKWLLQEFSEWSFFHSFGTSNSRGCSILIHSSVKFDVIDIHSDTVGRYILLNITIDNNTYTLLNIYAYNDACSRNNFFQKTSKLLTENAQGLIICGGDMNDILNSSDRYNSNHTKCFKPGKCLQQLTKSHKLVDVWTKILKQ